MSMSGLLTTQSISSRVIDQTSDKVDAGLLLAKHSTGHLA